MSKVQVHHITKDSYQITGLTDGSGKSPRMYLNITDIYKLKYELGQIIIKHELQR